MPRRHGQMALGLLEGLVGSLEARTKQKQETAKEEREHQRALELERLKAVLKPVSAEEQINRQILGLLEDIIPREPEPEEAQSAIPSFLLERARQPGVVTAPGPAGGVVMGRGEVAPGQPSAADVLTERIGLPSARAQQEAKSAKASRLLETLSRFGIGTLSQSKQELGGLEDVLQPTAGETLEQYVRRVRSLGLQDEDILSMIQQLRPEATIQDIRKIP